MPEWELPGSWTINGTTAAAPGANDFVKLNDSPQRCGNHDHKEGDDCKQTPKGMFGLLWKVLRHEMKKKTIAVRVFQDILD